MSFRLELSHQAKKALKLLDKTTIKRMEQRFSELSQSPFDPRHCQSLEMGEGEWKTRVGNWRIIYLFNEADQTI
jgi:mRNA-degrading endonuclease RelE of RelBE toxin-antitoxin system